MLCDAQLVRHLETPVATERNLMQRAVDVITDYQYILVPGTSYTTACFRQLRVNLVLLHLPSVKGLFCARGLIDLFLSYLVELDSAFGLFHSLMVHHCLSLKQEGGRTEGGSMFSSATKSATLAICSSA